MHLCMGIECVPFQLVFFIIEEQAICNSMIGKGGVTHNMLDDIHNHWKNADAVRIKCLGVPTLDMENLCFHLEVQGNMTAF